MSIPTSPTCGLDKLKRVRPHDPSAGLGPALACALIAQTGNVLLAALAASQLPGGYRVRSSVFVAALLWSMAGTVLLLVRTAGAGRPGAGALRLARIVLWLISAWAWPLLLLWRRPAPRDVTPS
jgi:hypothetical protein